MFSDDCNIVSCRILTPEELADCNLTREKWPPGFRPVLATYSCGSTWVYWLKDSSSWHPDQPTSVAVPPAGNGG